MKKHTLIFRWLYNEKNIIIKIYFLAVVQGAMYLSIPLGVQGVITYIMAGRFSASLILLCCLTIVTTAFIGFFQLWQMRLNETLNQKIVGDVVSKISFYLKENTPTSGAIAKINKFMEIITLQKSVSKILLDFSFSIISIVFGLLILPLYSTWFLLFTILLSASFYFIITYYAQKGIDTNIATSNAKYTILEGLQDADSYANVEQFSTTSNNNLQNYFNNRNQHYAVLETQYKGIFVFKVVFVSVLLFLGAYLVQIGGLTIGQFIGSEIIVFLVINAVEKLVGSLNICYDVITALYKIEGVLNNDDNYSYINNHKGNKLSSLKSIYTHPYTKVIKTLLLVMFGTGAIVLFLPWTQTIESEGKVTKLNPEDRPQAITTRIAGRIEKWYITEGVFVKKNDTIAFISEIKDEYVDPQLVNRSQQIISKKETTIQSYENKINAVDAQIDALNKSLLLKIAQTRNKIKQAKTKISTDSNETVLALGNYKLAEDQYKRYETLLTKGLISKTEVENRKLKLQETMAKKIAIDNKYSIAINDLLNVEMELSTVQQEYQEKLMKAESDKFSTLSSMYESEGALTKLQNQLTNYSMRKSYNYILAPQDGYISKAYVQGIGEIVKEGASLCEIVPIVGEQSVELYIYPVDLPLIQKGQLVQLAFDGWPAFVFSGWPGMSTGTYTAEIIAFDKSLATNGKFRLLAKQHGEKWPAAIQIGGGVKGFALLNNVPLIYELWRKANGFAPEFYTDKKEIKNDAKNEYK
ncbi:MAG: HlyD family efflux transporter periplasmic adaptor subunit [Bacteroidia bacterium]|nr:HlyD family efflux transporter periplasmic adaptor subunit [Bacteroidia bacterium]